MQNLGKIILLCALFTTGVYAGVVASLEPKRNIYPGDLVTYILIITGSKAQKPNITGICGNPVIATGSQTSIQSINGNYKKSYILSYQFVPQKSCTIDGVEMEIDGKIEKSNSTDLVVSTAKQSVDENFIITITPSKTDLYVGEPFNLTLSLKQKNNVGVIDSKFAAPDFKGFWMKSESAPQRIDKSGYTTTKVTYRLAPQREGNLTISPAQLKIASRIASNNWAAFTPQAQWKNYYSNEVMISAKAIPNGAKIIGDFTISAKADKTEINPNEAVNVTIKISGSGNLEDITSFKPYVPDVNVFDEKIVVANGKLTQKLAFVSDRDFIIPAFNISYFNVKSQKVENLTTKAIAIKVSGNAKKSEVFIKREETIDVVKAEVKQDSRETPMNLMWIIAAFFIGLIIGAVLMTLKKSRASTKSKKIDFRDEKLLLIKLLPFKDEDKEVREIVEILEKNIYSKEKQKIDNKLLKEIVKKYEIN